MGRLECRNYYFLPSKYLTLVSMEGKTFLIFFCTITILNFIMKSYVVQCIFVAHYERASFHSFNDSVHQTISPTLNLGNNN